MKRYWWTIAFTLIACFPSRERATTEAKQYAKDMGYEILGVSCTDIDTDSDGYVTCTVRVKGAQDGIEVEPLNLQCAADGPLSQFNSGCKLSLPKLNVKTTVHAH